ncbi:MAG: PadR family transcriptional regulator [Gemmatimonas sp.]|nr:PadR family transcriptional regulator [Gemmatimonas sp.]
MASNNDQDLRRLEYHVLLALAAGALYGYAVKDAVLEDSGGALNPRAGSLYRVFARLLSRGFVEQVEHEPSEPHPGLERKYYGLTRSGRTALESETARLRPMLLL